MCAKVTAPLFSLDASGNIARVITYSKTFGGNIVKKTPRVRELPSGLQNQVREVFRDGKNIWNGMTEGEKQVYIDMAAGKPRTGFNMFMSEYLEEHLKFLKWAKYGVGRYGVNTYGQP